MQAAFLLPSFFVAAAVGRRRRKQKNSRGVPRPPPLSLRGFWFRFTGIRCQEHSLPVVTGSWWIAAKQLQSEAQYYNNRLPLPRGYPAVRAYHSVAPVGTSGSFNINRQAPIWKMSGPPLLLSPDLDLLHIVAKLGPNDGLNSSPAPAAAFACFPRSCRHKATSSGARCQRTCAAPSLTDARAIFNSIGDASIHF